VRGQGEFRRRHREVPVFDAQTDQRRVRTGQAQHQRTGQAAEDATERRLGQLAAAGRQAVIAVVSEVFAAEHSASLGRICRSS
jgi:hypothetical protein